MRPSLVLINPAAAVSGAVGAGSRAAVEAKVAAVVKAEVAKVQTVEVRAEVVRATAINRFFLLPSNCQVFYYYTFRIAPCAGYEVPNT